MLCVEGGVGGRISDEKKWNLSFLFTREINEISSFQDNFFSFSFKKHILLNNSNNTEIY